MKLLTAFLVVFLAQAQTMVYLRSAAPQAVPIVSVSAATPAVITVSQVHGYSVGDIIVNGGVCATEGGGAQPGASKVNGIFKVASTPTTLTFTITDLSNNPIGSAGMTSPAACANGGSVAGGIWTGKLTAFTLGTQPLGWLDGLNGTIYRKLSTGTANGLATSAGLVVTGSPSACVITVTTTYNPQAFVGMQFGIHGTTSSALNNSGSPYTVATFSSTGFATAPAACSVSNGDYTTNMACGPKAVPDGLRGTTQNCTRISQLAWTGEPMWDQVIQQSAFTNGTGYLPLYEGGTQAPDSGMSQNWSVQALQFLVDPTYDHGLAVSVYGLRNAQKISGVNWTGNLTVGQAGSAFNQNSGASMQGFAWLYMAAASYISSADRTLFLNNIYNDLDDATLAPCSTANADLSNNHNEILATGTAAAGSASTITLATASGHPDNYYVHNVIVATVAGSPSYGLVSGFVASTKVATVGSWSNGNPTAGTAYTIYATITNSSMSSGSGGTTSTVTGYNTTFTTHLAAGDAVMGQNVYASSPAANQSLVVGSPTFTDTSMTVINSGSPTADTTVPSIVWYIKQHQTGDCGLVWLGKGWEGYSGSQPILYPPNGGDASANGSLGPTQGANNSAIPGLGHITLDIAVAPDEPRAVRQLAIQQSFQFDYLIQHYMTYGQPAHSGQFYNFATTGFYVTQVADALALSIPTFPSMDLAGNWSSKQSLWKMFSVEPDFRANDPNCDTRHIAWPLRVAAESGINCLGPPSIVASSFLVDPVFLWAPTSDNAKYLRNFMENIPPTNMFGGAALTGTAYSGAALTQIDTQRIGSVDYRGMAHQYMFGATSAAQAHTLTGWTYPANFNGNAMISNTGFSNTSAAQLYFGARTYVQDHDQNEGGTVRLYQVGEILNTDIAPPGNGFDNQPIGGMVDTMPQFGGTDAPLKNGIGGGFNDPSITPITNWAGPAGYGDPSSRYAYACADLSGAYTPASVTVTTSQRCVAHLKETALNGDTADQVIVQWDYIAASNPGGGAVTGGVAWHLHYNLNGETQAQSSGAYDEGNTTCPGSGGCASLDTSRWLQSLENGATTGGNPPRTHGIVSRIFSPGVIHVNWGCPSNVECTSSPLSTYPGGNGHTDRIDICAGPTCGSAYAPALESLVAHKVVRDLSDITWTPAALNPNANWTGFTAPSAVFLMSRGGVTHNAIGGFTTTHSGTAQYLFAGLTAGVYTVTKGGVAVTGSPFTVVDGDNTIYFDSASGSIVVTAGSGPTPSQIGTIVIGIIKAIGNIIIH